jgi:hypothetical protein
MATDRKLTEGQLAVLGILRRESVPVTANEVSEWVGFSARSTLVALAKRGLVEQNANRYWHLV